MCGIAGIYLKNAQNKVELNDLKKMSDSLYHRGPDGEGQWINNSGNMGMSHRRLSIIDLSEDGAQPMVYDNGRYAITYNGEIYNFLEIRERLVSEGFHFKSTSDTEVLLALYSKERENCLQFLDGMYSFAIWDEVEKTLFCARDRFGEKPFHYYWDGFKFVFASEMKALFAVGIPREIDYTRVQKFLYEHKIELGEFTFFKNIKKLLQSQYLIVHNGTLEFYTYYDIDLRIRTMSGQPDSVYAARFQELFATSIKRRLRSDVPVGSCLSGGLDSSSVVCFMAKELQREIVQKTFSARFENFEKDEGKWMQIVSHYAKTEHHEVYPDINDIAADIDDMIYHHEYPFGSSSQCAWWYVMKMAKENSIKVLLDGQGADEYLAGYPIMKNFLLMEYLFKLKFKEYNKARNGYKSIYGKQYPLGKMLWAHPLLFLINHPRSVYKSGKTFRERLKYEIFFRLQELLAYADRTSMAFSLEVRLPFLFHELIEYAFSLPENQLYHYGTTKYVLRNAIKGVVPETIVFRMDKLGYETPEDEWLPRLTDAEEDKIFLRERNLIPGPSKWRNFIARIFIRRFEA